VYVSAWKVYDVRRHYLILGEVFFTARNTHH